MNETSAVSIRLLEASDLASLSVWMEQKDADGWSLSMRDGWKPADFLQAECASKTLARHCYVALSNTEVCGVCLVQCVLDEATLLYIAVSPQYRRQGIASLLLRHQLSDLPQQGIERFFLEVRASNVPAIAFYQALGFSSCGCRPNYYAERQSLSPLTKALPAEDALLMSYSFY